MFFSITIVTIPRYAFSQENSSDIQFHGRNILTGQYSNDQGLHSEVPKDFLRNDLRMTLSVNGLPIATNFFITTEQRDYKQSINNIRFYIDLNTLKRNRSRIKAKKEGNRKGLGMLNFFSNFSTIEVGKVRPNYGELTLQGVSLSGVNIEFTNKIVYAAFATGRLRRAGQGLDIYDTTYKRKLMFGKLGFGEKHRTHLYFTYMHIEDETQGPVMVVDTLNDSTLRSRPKSNTVFGSEFRLSFIRNKWVIDGEIGISFLTRDTENPFEYDYDSTILENIPDFMINIVDPNVTTSFDIAYGVSTKLNLRTTTITAGYRLIGAGYTTLGNPNLINDRQTIEGRIDQAINHRKITLSAYFKQYKDNLINWKSGTTVSTFYGIVARFTFPKIPYFQVGFTPSKQETTGDYHLINDLRILNASTGYSYPIGELDCFTNLGYFYQHANNRNDSTEKFTINNTFTLNQTLRFNFPLNINFNFSYSDIKLLKIKRKVLLVALSATHQAFDRKWTNKIGGTFMQSRTNSNQNKISLFWDTRVKLWSKGTFGVIIQENLLRTNNPKANDFNEFIARCNLTIGW